MDGRAVSEDQLRVGEEEGDGEFERGFGTSAGEDDGLPAETRHTKTSVRIELDSI